jgi:hypothetical protein
MQALSERAGWNSCRRFPFTERQWIWLTFAVALCTRFVLAYITFNPEHIYTGEAEWIGKSIASHGGFSGAYAVPTGPTAHCGPFYSTLVALIYSLLGTGRAAEMVRIGLLIVVNSVACGILPVVARSLRLPLWCGVGAGLFAAFIPMHRTGEIFHAWDEPYAALGLMLAVSLFARLSPLSSRRPGALIGYGALWGVLLHVSAPMVLILAGLCVSGLLVKRGNVWAEGRCWLLIWVTAALVLAPWAVRNRLELGGWIFVRSNLGIELQMANNERAGPTNNDNRQAGLYRNMHPSVNVGEAERLRSMGELAYNRECLSRAWHWIRTHPRRFSALTLARLRIFWFGWWGDPETAWIFSVETLLAAVGAWRLWRENRRQTLGILGVVWLCYPLTFYIVQHLPRYRISMWWTVLMSASYGAGWVVRKMLNIVTVRESTEPQPVGITGVL